LPREVWRAERERGRYVPLPSPEEAAAYQFSAAEDQRRAALRPRALAGTPDRVAQRLRAVAEELAADEVAIVTAAHDPQMRRRSYILLAKAFGLTHDVNTAALAAD